MTFVQGLFVSGKSDSGIIRTGWAILCETSCETRKVEASLIEPGATAPKRIQVSHSELFDSLELGLFKLAYVIGNVEATKNYEVFTCEESGIGLVQNCNIVSRTVRMISLFSIYRKANDAAHSLKFLETPVKDITGMIQVIDDKYFTEVEYSTLYTVVSTVFVPFTWMASLACTAPEVPDLNVEAALKFKDALLKQTSTLGSRLGYFRMLSASRIEEARAGQTRLTQYAEIVKVLHQSLTSSLRREGIDPTHLQCRALLNKNAKALQKKLDDSRHKHQSEESKQLRGIAVTSFSILFGVLEMATDGALPGVGSLVHSVRAAASGALSAAEAVAKPEVIQSLSKMVKLLGSLESTELAKASAVAAGGGLGIRVSGNLSNTVTFVGGNIQASVSDTLSDRAQTNAKQKAKAVLHGASLSSLESSIPDYRKAVAAVKDIMQEVLMGGLTNVAWSAAEFIPIIGPFVGIVNSLQGLYGMVGEARDAHIKYKTEKDPMLRTLIRLRDCMLDTFLKSGASRIAFDTTKTRAVREAALLSAIDSANAAVAVNLDLVDRLAKQGRLWGTAEAHEVTVMKRLQSGQWKDPVTGMFTVGTIVPDKEKGDSLLPDTTIIPSRWDAVLGSLASRVRYQVDGILVD